MARKFNTATGRWDWCRNEDYQLHTAITLSLMTDARALPGQHVAHPRGWWGSSFSKFPNWQMGSRLWTLQGRPINNDTLLESKALSEQALAHLVEDGFVSEVSVTPTRDGDKIALAVYVTQPGSTAPELVDIWRIAING